MLQNIYYEDECFAVQTKERAKEVIGNIVFNNLICDYDCFVHFEGNDIFIEARKRGQ